ncbi:MAG: hypothetical protein JOZ69_16565, partial [Myxococcales bacterium]|nr:hypothetical protein [Myxococcales bacterium]
MRREVWFVACAVLGGGGIAAAAVLSGACIVAPPPDLPIASHAPVILHPSLDPPEGLLMNWPGADNGYTVAIPVEFFDPNPTYAVHVFVDYPGQPGLVYQGPGTRRSVAPSQGGASLIEVPVDPTNPPIDLSACHTIEVFVAH